MFPFPDPELAKLESDPKKALVAATALYPQEEVEQKALLKRVLDNSNGDHAVEAAGICVNVKFLSSVKSINENNDPVPIKTVKEVRALSHHTPFPCTPFLPGPHLSPSCSALCLSALSLQGWATFAADLVKVSTDFESTDRKKGTKKQKLTPDGSASSSDLIHGV